MAKGRSVGVLPAPRFAAALDNSHIRHLLWTYAASLRGRFIDPALVAAAISALDSLFYYDTIEDPLFQEQRQSWLGMPLLIPHLNEGAEIALGHRQPLSGHLSDDSAELLAAHTRLDACLWSVAVQWFVLDPE